MKDARKRVKITKRTKKSIEDISQENIKVPVRDLKPYTQRKFPNNLHYLSKHLKTMLIEGTNKFLPKFWDDDNITLDEWNRIEWMAGVEVHLHKHIIAIYGRNERDHRQKYLGSLLQVMNKPTGFEEFQETLQEYKLHISRFLMETTGIYHFPVFWQLESRFPNSQVIAMNAGDLKDHMPKVSKNDKADAVRMAQVAQLDDFIRKSYIPSPDEFALRELLRQRTKIVRNLVRLKNVIRKIFASTGFSYRFNFEKDWEMKVIQTFLETESTIKEALDAHQDNIMVKKNRSKYKDWLGFNMGTMFKANILLLLGLLGQTRLNVEMVEAALLRKIDTDPILQKKLALLENCNGIGILTAVGIIMESGDITRFYSVSHYLSYCGIGPSEGTSGYEDENTEEEKVVMKAKPNPHSNRELKHLFVGATGAILKASKDQRNKPTQRNDMIRYSERYLDDKRAKLKIKFKIAAKLARRVYYCLLTDQKYDPELEYRLIKESNDIKSKNEYSRTPIRKRKAWAYLKMKRMQVDIEDFLDKLQLYGEDDERISRIRNDFKQFMLKYKFPGEFGEDSLGVKA